VKYKSNALCILFVIIQSKYYQQARVLLGFWNTDKYGKNKQGDKGEFNSFLHNVL